jgi:hypothetical protein
MSTDTSVSDSVPREPSAFRPSIHFAGRQKDLGTDRNRHLDGDIINGCITDGERDQRTDAVYWLRETFDAVTYRLVVNVEEGEVITGYPIGIDPEAATQPGSRWTDEQVEDILHFIRTDPRTDE